MNRRNFLRVSACGLVGAALPHGVMGATLSPKRPNVLIVFPDQMRAQSMGFMHEDKVKTPHLDAFAQSSRVFNEAISSYPVCSPFRAMLMTGVYPAKNGVHTNCLYHIKHGASCELDREMVCWSDILAHNAYDMAYIGKWHLDKPYQPWIPTYNNQGTIKWNEWCSPDRRHGFSYWHAYGTYDDHLRPMYWDTHAKRDEYAFVNQWGPTHEVNQAINYLRTKWDKSKPFAMVISMNPPHTGYSLVPNHYQTIYKDLDPESLIVRPNVPPKSHPMGRFYRQNIRNYQACVTGVDDQFGRLMAALKEQGLEEDTVVFFFSDHGCCLGAHGCEAKNNPYAESICIPMMIRWPGHIAPRDDSYLIEPVDLAPTILGLTGGSIPPTMQGRNLAPYLLDEVPMPQKEWQLYMKHGEPLTLETPAHPVCDCSVKLAKPEDYGSRGIRNPRWTCVFNYGDASGQLTAYLFDRQTDPYELKNQAQGAQDLLVQMRTTLKTHLTAIGDPFAAAL